MYDDADCPHHCHLTGGENLMISENLLKDLPDHIANIKHMYVYRTYLTVGNPTKSVQKSIVVFKVG